MLVFSRSFGGRGIRAATVTSSAGQAEAAVRRVLGREGGRASGGFTVRVWAAVPDSRRLRPGWRSGPSARRLLSRKRDGSRRLRDTFGGPLGRRAPAASNPETRRRRPDPSTLSSRTPGPRCRGSSCRVRARVTGSPEQESSIMASLSYDVVADPAPLASRTGTPAVGTVHVLVSNPNTYHVKWHSTEVEVPFGSGTGALTSDHAVITPEITPRNCSPAERTRRSTGTRRAAHLAPLAPLAPSRRRTPRRSTCLPAVLRPGGPGPAAGEPGRRGQLSGAHDPPRQARRTREGRAGPDRLPPGEVPGGQGTEPRPPVGRTRRPHIHNRPSAGVNDSRTAHSASDRSNRLVTARVATRSPLSGSSWSMNPLPETSLRPSHDTPPLTALRNTP